MGIISREGTAPIQNGEVASGAEVEAEFNKLFVLVNGNLENVNISASAGLLGTQLANTTLSGDKVQDNTLTTAKMAAVAVPRAYVSSSSATSALSTATTYQDGVVGALAVANLTVGDLIAVDFNGGLLTTLAGSIPVTFTVGVDSTDQADIQTVYPGRWSGGWSGDSGYENVNFSWVFTATATSHSLQLRAKNEGGVAITWAPGISTFRALTIPQK